VSIIKAKIYSRCVPYASYVDCMTKITTPLTIQLSFAQVTWSSTICLWKRTYW